MRTQFDNWLRSARDDLLWMQDRFASLNASAGYGLTNLALRAETIQGIHREIAQRPAPPQTGPWSAAVFVGSAMLRTFVMPFEGTFMAGYAAGVGVGWAGAVALDWVGLDTRANRMWAEDQLSGMWEGFGGMVHSLTTAEGWENWWRNTSALYNSGRPFEAGWGFGDQVAPIAFFAYSGAKGAGRIGAETRIAGGVEQGFGSIGRTGGSILYRNSGVVEVDPRTLRWSQRSAGGNNRFDAVRTSMAEHGWKGDPIDVVLTKDGLVTVDHTRPLAAIDVGLKRIPARVHMPNDPLPADMLGREWNRAGQTATTWGEGVRIRTASQRPPLGPTGTQKRPDIIPPKRKR